MTICEACNETTINEFLKSEAYTCTHGFERRETKKEGEKRVKILSVNICDDGK